MANKRLSDLPVVTSTTTGDVVAIDGATTRQITTENLLGDNVQSIKALTSAADKVPYFTGAGTSDVADITAYGRSIIAVADEAAFKALTNLEIGTDVQGYSSALDAVSGTNTGDQTITLTGDVTGTGTGSFATTISATAVTSSMLNPDVFSTAHSWSGQQTFVAPALGTPASGVATNLTGTASGLTAGHVTTNANLTGDVTSVGNASTIGATKVTSAMLNADVFSTAHSWSGVQTFTNPIVGTQTAGDSSTKAASTAFVVAAVASSGGGSGASNEYDTVAALNAATVSVVFNSVVTLGYYAKGDGGGTRYVRAASAPSKPGYQTSDGGTVYWDLPDRSTINVKWLGAKGDGATDDITAIQNSIAALPAGGGTVFFPQGNYLSSGTCIDLLDKFTIAFVGVGSGNGNITASSTITLTNAGTASLISLDGTEGIRFQNIGLMYNNASYTGKLINLRQRSGGVVTAFTTFEEFRIGGTSNTVIGATLVDVGKTLKTYFKHGFMSNGSWGILGPTNLATDFCNILVVDDVWFDNRFSNPPIMAGGENWGIYNCAFEPPTSSAGQARGVASTPWGINGLTISNCNIADASSGTWIDTVSNFGFGAVGKTSGFVFTNNFVGNGTGTSILGGNIQGGLITGNWFYSPSGNPTHITGGATATSLVVYGNRVTSSGGEGVGTIIDATPAHATSLVDRNTGNGLSFGDGGTSYVYLPGKKLIAWGQASGITTSYSTVSFGVTFGSAPLVTATCVGAAVALNMGGGTTTTGFPVATASGTQIINWQAIGNAP